MILVTIISVFIAFASLVIVTNNYKQINKHYMELIDVLQKSRELDKKIITSLEDTVIKLNGR